MRNLSHEISPWLELREAADHLGVHFTTLRRWADAGKVPCIRTPGGHRRFREADLDAFLNSMQRNDDSMALVVSRPHSALVAAQPSHAAVRNEPWYGRLDEVQRTAMRGIGQQMMAVLMQYAVRENGGEAFLDEGRRIARQYGEICFAVGLTLVETISGFTLVRRSIADSVYQAGTLAGPPDTDSWRLLDRMNNFLDTMLLNVVEAFEQRDRHSA